MVSVMLRCLFARHRFCRVVCVLAVLTVCSVHVTAQDRNLKSELESALRGKTVVSKIVFGGKATPRGYQVAYPVNTLVYPNTNQVIFRVEWGIMRTEVGPGEMGRRFSPGTSFQIANIDLKDDRLELKLDTDSGDSARLKLMLGAGWQSKFDAASVQTQLARIFVLAQQSQPPSQTSTAAAASTTALPGFAGAGSTSEYRRDPNAPKIEGRISDNDLKTIMAGFDEQTRDALSTLSQDAAALSRGLLTYQKAYSVHSDYASRPQLQAIAGLQDRLGKSLDPQRDDDVIEMNEVFRRCVRVAQLGQARDERGNLLGAGRNSADFQQLLLSNSASDLSNKVQRDVEIERAQRLIIDHAKTAVITVEQTLDKRDLSGANQQYQQLASDRQIAQVSPLQQYLQLTAAFRQDLLAFLQATQMDRRRDIAVVQQVENVRREADLLNTSESEPLTRTYLQNTLKADTDALRQRLASVPAFQFDEASYKIPTALAETTPSNLNEKLTFVSGRITDIDTNLASASELRAIVTQPEVMKRIEDVVGADEAVVLRQDASRISAAEQMRASLAAEQQALQQRMETAEVETTAKLTAAISMREQFAEELTKRMSNEISWCAGGRDGELLAGYITTSQLSPGTLSQVATNSPLWKELYAKGFRFSGVFAPDQTTKSAAITADGAVGALITTIPDKDRTDLESAIDILKQRAKGGQVPAGCLPAKPPADHPEGP
jgi:hypothetical protein